MDNTKVISLNDVKRLMLKTSEGTVLQIGAKDLYSAIQKAIREQGEGGIVEDAWECIQTIGNKPITVDLNIFNAETYGGDGFNFTVSVYPLYNSDSGYTVKYSDYVTLKIKGDDFNVNGV